MLAGLAAKIPLPPIAEGNENEKNNNKNAAAEGGYENDDAPGGFLPADGVEHRNNLDLENTDNLLRSAPNLFENITTNTSKVIGQFLCSPTTTKRIHREKANLVGVSSSKQAIGAGSLGTVTSGEITLKGRTGRTFSCIAALKTNKAGKKNPNTETKKYGISFDLLLELSSSARAMDSDHVAKILFAKFSPSQAQTVMEHYVTDGVKLANDIISRLYHRGNYRPILDLIQSITFQVLHGLRDLHAQNIIHMDLKPENILYDEKKKLIKIIDFGTSRYFIRRENKLDMLTITGTLFYRAPEMFSGGGYN